MWQRFSQTLSVCWWELEGWIFIQPHAYLVRLAVLLWVRLNFQLSYLLWIQLILPDACCSPFKSAVQQEISQKQLNMLYFLRFESGFTARVRDFDWRPPRFKRYTFNYKLNRNFAQKRGELPYQNVNFFVGFITNSRFRSKLNLLAELLPKLRQKNFHNKFNLPGTRIIFKCILLENGLHFREINLISIRKLFCQKLFLCV
jgi:hypothetical protein